MSVPTKVPVNKAAGTFIFSKNKIKITENKLRNVPSDFNLLPGMNVSGNIISGKRPIITYLIYPVIKTINTAMREP